MLKHFFASCCLKYLVSTISVISVTDLWSFIRIYKKGSIETLLRSFNRCQARQLLQGAVTWLCTKLEYNTTKSGFWGKLALFKVISERYRTRLIYTIFDIFWEWCKNIVDQKYIIHTRHYNLAKPWLDKIWSVISVTVISMTFPSISYVIYMGKNNFRYKSAHQTYLPKQKDFTIIVYCVIDRYIDLKGHWTSSTSSPTFSKKVEIFIPLEVLALVMTACGVLRSRLTYFWGYMNISSIFYFSKSTSINTQLFSSLWGTLKMMLFTKYLIKWKRIGRISWNFRYKFGFQSFIELDIKK